MARGLAFMLKEMNRKGAVRRGKSYHDFYDEEDRVNFDPADFAVGAAEETGHYMDKNKARLVGATIGAMTTVTLGVFLTPWVGLGAGILAGQGTTVLMNFTEKKIKDHQKKKDMEDPNSKMTRLEKSIAMHDQHAKEMKKKRLWKRLSVPLRKKAQKED
ncbi:MAG: hypothetical protein SGILL_006630 [Bacillariaceae sp.]